MSTGRLSSYSIAERTCAATRFALVLLVVLAIGGCGFIPNSRATALYPLQWQPAASLPAHVASFVFAPSARNIGYACTVATEPIPATPTEPPAGKPTPAKPTPTPTAVYHTVVSRSADGGMTWAALATPFPPGRACRIFIAGLDAGDVFVALPASATDESGLLPVVWRSHDGGASWQALGQITQPGEHESFAAITVVGQRLVAEITSIGVPTQPPQLYASTDDGKTWNILEAQPPLSGLYAVGNTLYANREPANATSGSPPPPLYRSTDGGMTWVQVSAPFPDVSDLAFTLASDTAHTYGAGLIPAATAYGANAHAVIVSRDGGATWSRVDAPPTIGTLGVVLLPNGTLLAQSVLQDTQPAGGFTAELFRLRPGETAWQLIGLGLYVTGWQVARASARSDATMRLWAIAPGPDNPTRYVSADLP